jgi:predicted O-methyltransferase YrrM
VSGGEAVIWETKADWLAAANEAGVTGFMHPSEVAKLVELAEGRDVLEIGSYRGLSAWCMAHSAKSLMAVDTHRAWTNGQTQNSMEEGLTTLEAFQAAVAPFENVEYFVGTSAEANAARLRRLYGMVFLDANHTYEDVKKDIGMWWPRVKKGGVFVMHDYGHWDFPGVKKAADEVFGDLGDYAPGTQDWVVTLRWVFKN